MLDFLKRGKTQSSNDNTSNKSTGLFSVFKQGLKRSRDAFSEGIATVVVGKKVIDAELFEELEALLLSTDVGITVTEEIIEALEQELKRKELSDSHALQLALKTLLKQVFVDCQKTFVMQDTIKPRLILMVGINGAGKTTTLGKLAKKFKEANQGVMLAAGDTFRAAAIEQLKVWGDKNATPVIAQHPGADSAAVIFDAFEAAKARKIDVLLADTAGRLHTQDALMEELKKVVRVVKKLDNTAPHEILLVLDAGIGQNALIQAQTFHKALGVTGLVVTKLDGTAKGGVLFNIARTLKLPIYFVGMGEGIDDLKPFDSDMFVEALFT